MNAVKDLESSTEHVGSCMGSERSVGKPGKSDMCLINELVRGLSLRHEYRLVSESGPAHRKTFTVNLRLGDLESYEGSGPSIKKAQQAAASRALKETKLSHSLHSRKKRSSMTPTVELNVYAMKQGIQVNYVVHEPRILVADGSNPCPGGTSPRYTCCSCPSSCSSSQLSPSTQSTHSTSSWNSCSHQSQSSSWNSSSPSSGHHPGNSRSPWNSGHSQSWSHGNHHQHPSWNLQPGQRYMSTTDLYEAIVTVGNYQFYGTGRTPQGARHSAAQAALDSIHSSSSTSCYSGNSSPFGGGWLDDGSSQASTSSMSSSISTMDGGGGNQRPVIVSLLKRASELNLSVNFQVVQNLGPSHLPTFITQCTAGRFVVQSQGHSKKESKKRAAGDMLALLNQIKIVPNGQIAPSHGQQVLMAAAAASGQGILGSGQGILGSGPGILGSGQGILGSGQGILGSGPGVLGSGQGVLGSGQGVLGSGQGILGNAPGILGNGPGILGNAPIAPNTHLLTNGAVLTNGVLANRGQVVHHNPVVPNHGPMISTTGSIVTHTHHPHLHHVHHVSPHHVPMTASVQQPSINVVQQSATTYHQTELSSTSQSMNPSANHRSS